MGNSIIARAEHRLYIENKRRRLKNKDFSILSDNCNSGIILHDLGQRFNSPTVNLYFESADFIKFLKNPQKYLNADPIQTESDKPFPVGKIDDITVFFMHYPDFNNAREQWKKRSARVNFDNLFVMMTDKNGCTYEQIADFDSLPYAHKAIFTHKPYPEFKSACCIKGFENDGEVGVLSDWKPGFLKRRYLDDFDYVAFLNGEIYNFSEFNR